ncbi:sugar O-acetyltransferase [Actinomyces haliotis]|uniref:sugar O-acetyltransferase n=1 Tax=Actinomyces haliotis TaxID=1280843 RepID=UPI001E562B01|nr:sugar O-acetyltransferase [Actinomyces haliotis]
MTTRRRSDPANWIGDDERTDRERMLAGDWYTSGDPDSRAISARADELCLLYWQEWARDQVAAQHHLRELIGSLGDGVRLKPPLSVDYGRNISIGESTFINYGLTALDVAPIRIGVHCQIGPNVQLLTPVHPVEPGPRETGLESADPITIGDNVWLGGGVIVYPGVTIGDDSVIGAGSVVTRDVPAGVIAVGQPARVLREIDDSAFRLRR